MMIPEVLRRIDVEAETGNAALNDWADVGLPFAPLHAAGTDPLEDRANLLHHREPGIAPLELESQRAKHAAVTLHRCGVGGKLFVVRLAIASSAAPTVLLVRPEHHANGAFRSEAKLLHE